MKRVPLELPEEMLAEVDEARGDVPRNTWIRRAIEQRLEKEEENGSYPHQLALQGSPAVSDG